MAHFNCKLMFGNINKYLVLKADFNCKLMFGKIKFILPNIYFTNLYSTSLLLRESSGNKYLKKKKLTKSKSKSSRNKNLRRKKLTKSITERSRGSLVATRCVPSLP